MIYLEYKTLDPAAADDLLNELTSEDLYVADPEGKVVVNTAVLPFYRDFILCAVTKPAPTAPNMSYFLYRPGNIFPLNWTNEPIYNVNMLAPIRIDRTTCIPYARFFFHFVRGNLGCFNIAEKPEDVNWLPNASADEKQEVNRHLMPIAYKGIGQDNLLTLTATIVFKNALFRSDIKISPYTIDVLDKETNEMKLLTNGQMVLVNEELLMEDLDVHIDQPLSETAPETR
jgi:hypothetical protein